MLASEIQERTIVSQVYEKVDDNSVRHVEDEIVRQLPAPTSSSIPSNPATPPNCCSSRARRSPAGVPSPTYKYSSK